MDDRPGTEPAPGTAAPAPALAALGLGLAAIGRPAYITTGRDADLHDDRSVEAMRGRALSVTAQRLVRAAPAALGRALGHSAKLWRVASSC